MGKGVPGFIACSQKRPHGGNSIINASVVNGVTVLLRARAMAVLLAIVLAASACGAGSDAPAAAPPASLAPGTHLFPEVEVVRLAGEESVNLASLLANGDQAVLLWFWAPH